MSTPGLILDALGGIAAGVYAQQMPPAASKNVQLPAVVFHEVAYVEGPHSHDGLSGWDRPRWQFDCWAETYAAARMLAAEVQTALRASDLGARIVGRIDMPEPGLDLYRVVVDATLWTPAEETETQGS